ncbi:hypothetical protein [Streptomyces poriferorum]|uniref:Uncharacterized protein n=1 Tax=Streptomyces poriferorum TaxID=2798799 RepID=A0ABY9IUI0_9ACTN|nr:MULTISPECIES: hypothetical protein [unclassified Streptomyces]MDP5312038.1 hypothetical protein [Streptomyces sp. Alt4]WLQ58905.1 hypothetical protein P8A19_27280 [Streptomyces sp. Alt2]
MSEGRPTDAYRCGQLYAALETLQLLADIGSRALGRADTRENAARRPRTHMTEPLIMVGRSLHSARLRGRAAAAGAVFRMIPDLLPAARDLPGSQDAGQCEEFARGRREQLEVIGKETAAL